MPFGVAWAMADVMGAVWRIFRREGEPPITRQMLRLIGQPFTIDISRARNQLATLRVISPAEGMRRMQARGASPAQIALGNNPQSRVAAS
ncbi:hypothetical protein ABID21_000109 [Pseudorhizobium tarimense]|uniref:Transposase n=1 Tax=Pseudorhizobium tarimense TaxID=1079109 RepID=A0ABV2H129_9HYPH|nr:hypothetical protein [Pseudorhizobium tarimense]MCJ8517360.1 hypothetical protein [Pseudorhizobium tarimense]